ncbi:phosphoribosylanthranilate isomerase [Beijerinckia indica]|uniref:N-(5'-phosphoribosyl)anthranilate isomerase n=1 Tax=Beijerinckia indica subsp. indica (strain ATCC 9039 / DSM 1715 / NCIMB 8712) TaxID=395963 RepID=TRPF_BEII9|nr:phosphoribosylanthranilate isomerase [Beijerinckia indica]B2IKV4.1 RecName: Full=N-(5'-phosphoribosyl)anthranilate isomerase; Short=PRAI [Beijerinckia indica subsp. indica ATCC 9039]ACB96494.1 Phosphoribosylanthranilate isomerase [Beijerinckia indica subsp. indica ATCC 9039]
MPIMIKICGLRTEETLDAALDLGADMVGFVSFSKSPRHVSLDLASHLGKRVGDRALKVLLTVNADDASLAAGIAALDPQMLQVHGRETPERIASIRARFGLPVMKAISIGDYSDLVQIPLFDAVADLLLFDAKPKAPGGLPGGNGTAFDWSLLRHVETRKPWLLAGGLTSQNVAGAIAATNAQGVDVSSGVESAAGVKDLAKMAAFIEAARKPQLSSQRHLS